MDRRKHPRLVGPFQARWQARSGAAQRCRVGDLSLGGCFVHSQKTPTPGTAVTVTIDLDGEPSPPLSGIVVHEEWSDGFALRFGALDAARLSSLKNLMGRLREIRRSA